MSAPITLNVPQGSNTQKLQGTAKTEKELKSLRESCREFEAIFIDQMYKSMRQNLPGDGLVPQSNATNIYQDMLDMQMARETAKGKGMGIGEAMFNQTKGLIK